MNDGYATWHSDAANEPRMEEGHRPYWRHFIASIPETDLSTRTVLDFGCNRGGFLRLLHRVAAWSESMTPTAWTETPVAPIKAAA